MAVSALTIVHFYLKPKSPQKVYSESLNSVVEVKASTEGVGDSYGTAVFIKNDGTLVTNAYVVTYKQSGSVYTFDSYKIRFTTENDYRSVELVNYDNQLDLAVLKLTETCNFKNVTLGSSDNLKAGDKVYAVGNAFNYGISLTQGIVSILLLQMEHEGNVRKVIQCDLIINEGNSGGALLDENGKLIGITTFRIKDGFGNVVYGLAYCIPLNVVNDYLNG